MTYVISHIIYDIIFFSPVYISSGLKGEKSHVICAWGSGLGVGGDGGGGGMQEIRPLIITTCSSDITHYL